MKKQSKAILTARDLKLLLWPLENKVITRDQANKYIFKNVSKQCVNRRLKKLCDLKVMARRAFIDENKASYCYGLTEKGLSEIKKYLTCKVKGRVVKSDSIIHDLGLVEIRVVLEKMKMVKSYFTENALQGPSHLETSSSLLPFVRLNSDAVIEIETDHGKAMLAIEYDATKKSASRYRKKLEAYYGHHQIEGILYIAKDQRILRALKSVEKKLFDGHRKESKVYYALWENVMRANKEITFQSFDNYSLTLV